MACPICGKPTVAVYRPFCSKRCADIDLAHWLRGDYVVPGNTAADDELVPERPVDEE
ncbi:DNA gyrase inhibitor YacG [Paracoccus xiamenensis]|uniref:DNA gyrase inhibitor YacG n=1 Tax=Paracoccus xiamenensis TaxID=2714901 RepID=UPI0014085A8C|nr:DNA gyrase inhibitor YacG [Paracoccus xiamenensis]NHF74266.1 DNA gyrase inhibitor YacG [Paracoccus xiamenensis]